MMRFSFALAPLVSAEMTWEEFKNFYGKVYNGDEHDDQRKQIYEGNLHRIAHHNGQNKSWTEAMNFFGDFTEEEFEEFASSSPKTKEWEGEEHVVEDNHTLSLSSSRDWVSEGKVNAVRNQGHTMSCWAHSAIGTIESAYAIKHKTLHKLTEQQLCDCSNAGSCGNGGGDEQEAIPWAVKHNLCSRASYPFTGSTSHSCKESSCHVELGKGAVKGQKIVNHDASSWKSAIAGQPITCGVYGKDLRQFYSSGVLHGHGCGGEVNHAVIAVGYGTSNGRAYFKIRNSWGKDWGEHGYVRVAQSSSSSKGEACIYRWKASYPTIDSNSRRRRSSESDVVV